MSESDLFDPCVLNGFKLQNRIVFSPTTRARGGPDGEAGELQATYYSQRASAGMLITEATAVTPGGRGGPNLPGLWDDKHIAQWKMTTDAVHAKGGFIFSQLWHAGRLSHSSLSNGAPPVAPSAMKQPGKMVTAAGIVDYEEARELRLDEMPQIVDLYRQAAKRAKAAGFDGVQLHAAHSYLIDAFLRDMTNKRTDAYGGSIENRARLFVEVLQAMLESWSPDRVGVRIAPIGHAYGAWDSNPEPLFTYVVERMNDLKIGWMDMVEGDTGISRTAEPSFDLSKLRKLFKGVTITNNLYTRDLAIEARRTNSADMIAFSRAYISNPDLVERLRRNAPLNDPDLRTFYSGGPKGYIDYPSLAEA